LIASIAISAAATAAGWQQAARVTPEAAGLSAARLREATALLNRYVAERRIAGAVAAVARRGQVGYFETVGVQDLQTRAPMTERSLFRIYSMTRPVTAVAVMMLHEEGRFELDDPVARFIPEFKNVVVAGDQGARPSPAAKPMTVRDLLLHTSGLNARTSEIYRREQVRARTITMAQFIANLVRVPLMEEPGTRYRYSEGTTVLGRLVEIWSGKPFEAFLEERIFRPLRMTDTMFWASTAEQRARLATVYGPAEGGGLVQVETETLPFTERPTLIEGAVGLLSTVTDYLRFSQMLLNGGQLDGVRVLSRSSVALMVSDHLGTRIAAPFTPGELLLGTPGYTFGLGFAVRQGAGIAALPGSAGEFMWGGYAGTYFWVDPKEELVGVYMVQAPGPLRPYYRRLFKQLVYAAIND
jgi:CubicO group peptidase (beta-lactamase class C family)